MRDVDAIAVTSDGLMSRVSELFEIEEHIPDFHEPLALLKRPLPFHLVHAWLESLGLEIAGTAVLVGEEGEPEGPFHAVFAQGEVPMSGLQSAVA